MMAEIVRNSKNKKDAMATIFRLIRGRAASEDAGEEWLGE
jgi:hypothetical protein